MPDYTELKGFTQIGDNTLTSTIQDNVIELYTGNGEPGGLDSVITHGPASPAYTALPHFIEGVN